LPDGATVTLRRAGAADAAGIAHVHQHCWRTTYSGILPRDVIEQLAGRRSEETWQTRLRESGMHAVWVAEDAERIVGFASCGNARHRLVGAEAEVYALYVLQDRQRRGIGRELLRASARHFVAHGLFSFYLWVLKANRARLFYEAVGGEEVGQKSERLGLHSYDEIAYAWRDVATLLPSDAGAHAQP
jgi:ribosomal protein S18 acetylase RimI-like enzyme